MTSLTLPSFANTREAIPQSDKPNKPILGEDRSRRLAAVDLEMPGMCCGGGEVGGGIGGSSFKFRFGGGSKSNI